MVELHGSYDGSIQRGRFSGKICVVTASTDGIGFAIAVQFAAEDALAVYISSRKQKNVDSALAIMTEKYGFRNVFGNVCHVANRDQRQMLLQSVKSKHGRIDVLVLNAAVSTMFGPLLSEEHDVNESAWDKLFEINVKSTFFFAREAMPLLLASASEKRNSTNIVLISSIAGYESLPELGAYSITKTAMLALSRVLAMEAAAMNIRVNAVAPGIIKTRFSERLWHKPEDLSNSKSCTEQTSKNCDSSPTKTVSYVPLNRFGIPDDVSRMVAFVASSDADYITGETFVVAGGMRSRL
uniref:Dehydrogenase/reductase SDR family member 4 n=1 Tax=Timspurckia oligopyrenoides TaxID=708627 RepID=A0A7S0ZED2_9RHOD